MHSRDCDKRLLPVGAQADGCYALCKSRSDTDRRRSTRDPTKYRCTFHVVWCPKYCRPVITGPVDLRLKEIIREVCAERVAPIVELETVPDHVQLLVTCDPQFGIHRLVKQIKGRSSWLLRQEFPSLKSKLPTLWTNSYFVANSGWGDIGGRQPLRREPTQCLTDALTPHG